MPDKRWTIGLSIGWGTLFIASVAMDFGRSLVPASRWLEVRSVTIGDAPQGSWPKIHIDRVIRQEFRGSWIATVLRQENGGAFSHFCDADGENFYRAGTVVRPDEDLYWLLGSAPCGPNLLPGNGGPPALPAGRYMVTVVWTLKVPYYAEKQVSVVSNVFTIR